MKVRGKKKHGKGNMRWKDRLSGVCRCEGSCGVRQFDSLGGILNAKMKNWTLSSTERERERGEDGCGRPSGKISGCSFVFKLRSSDQPGMSHLEHL